MVIITSISNPSLRSYLYATNEAMTSEKCLVPEPLCYVEADARKGDERLNFWYRMDPRKKLWQT